MAILLSLFLIFSMVTYSNAAVCVCKDADDQALQKVIDYACGSGADCSQIEQNGACFQPNSVKNHCDVAVNSFYQKKASTGATCDFNGAAVVSTSPPSSILSETHNSTSTPATGTPSTGNSTTGAPSTGNTTTGMPTNPTTAIPTSSVFPPSIMGPSGSTGFDPSGGDELSIRTATVILLTTIAAVALRDCLVAKHQAREEQRQAQSSKDSAAVNDRREISTRVTERSEPYRFAASKNEEVERRETHKPETKEVRQGYRRSEERYRPHSVHDNYSRRAYKEPPRDRYARHNRSQNARHEESHRNRLTKADARHRLSSQNRNELLNVSRNRRDTHRDETSATNVDKTQSTRGTPLQLPSPPNHRRPFDVALGK
ncbi:unnamed protein product, partial [Eruca vesicaria subsp. sativa]|nr:unnamed protein product [Eruca vesicaria subsp. sativa]